MALIDVSELLVDADFVDDMQLITRVPVINNFGENSTTEMKVLSVGSVQPASGKALNRIPEALRVENMMSFWFKGEIPTTGPNVYPCLLVFHGKRFQVKQVFDWMNWGEGWSEGLCVAEVPA